MRRLVMLGVIVLLISAMGCASKASSMDVKIGPGQLTPPEIGGEVTSFAAAARSRPQAA